MTALLTAIDWLTHLSCVHQDIFRRAEGSLRLECLKCGRQTPGITVHTRAGVRTSCSSLLMSLDGDADARKH